MLGSDPGAGLADEEARRRLERAGPNVVPERPPDSALVVVARQFADAMVMLLVVAAVVSFVIGESVDGG